VDGSIKFLQVDNFPSRHDASLDDSTAVYVHKLNRIYIFGGWNEKRILDGIWYIDLPTPPTPVPERITSLSPPPSSPKLFDCSNLANGNHPHPTVLESFFTCRYGTQSGVFTCPGTLLFDTNLRTCNAPELIAPPLSCSGKTGPYPYPTDSTKFIVCRQGAPLGDVYECPKPLQFDPQTRACTLGDSVEHCSQKFLQ
jgi:hypothetical protein